MAARLANVYVIYSFDPDTMIHRPLNQFDQNNTMEELLEYRDKIQSIGIRCVVRIIPELESPTTRTK